MEKIEGGSTARSIRFGVGSFHFVPTSKAQFASSEAYAACIRSFLGSIDSVTDIDVRFGEGYHFFAFSPDPREGGNGPINPCPASGTVSFSIFLPERVQEKFSPFDDTFPSDRFRIVTLYNSTFPVTFVYPIEVPDVCESDPSHVVATVREYLEERCGREGCLNFVSIGPSPFHADFYLTEGHERRSLKVDKRLGYDQIWLNAVSDTPEEINLFIEELVEPLAHFYLSTYIRYASYDLSDKISQRLRRILDRLTERNPLISVKNAIIHSNRKDIAKVYSDMISLEQNVAEAKRNYLEDKGRIVDTLGRPMLVYVDEALSEYPSDIRDQLSPLLRLTEIFETSGSNNWSVLAAALLSAAITCIATLEVGLLSQQQSHSGRDLTVQSSRR